MVLDRHRDLGLKGVILVILQTEAGGGKLVKISDGSIHCQSGAGIGLSF